MVHFLASAATAILSASAVLAQAQGSGTQQQCGPGQNCPASAPCCSQYGACGVGAYCLGGCDPSFSFALDSCTPEPVCQSQNFSFKSLNGITSNTEYLGDASKADWVSSGTPLEAPTNDAVILTLSEDGASASGTLLASTSYVWYGKITAQMKSSRGAGVVSAFILLSDVRDEIDFEFIGASLDNVQSNYYFQGITNYGNELNVSVSGSDTFSSYHTYEIDWQPDQLTWSVDGNVMRTLKKSDTFNKTDNMYHYPQTPARVQLSIWPAGLSKNGQGTVDWAGGLINWNTQDVQSNGYYYAMYKEVDIQCYQPPSGANVSGKASYLFTNRNGSEESVSITDNPTILKSLLGTGTDMDKDYPHAKPSGTSSGAPAATSNVATIPGLTGAGPGTDGTRGGTDGSVSNPGSGTSGGSAVSSAAGAASTGVGGFSQGGSTKGNGAATKTDDLLRGSMFAVLIAFIGMVAI